jgi:cytoskeletal protein RodZ
LGWLTGLLRRGKKEELSAADATVNASEAAPAPRIPPTDDGIVNAQDFNPVIGAAAPAQSSEELFAEIGAELRTRREMLSLTHDEIERHTHVRAAFLAALEKGAIKDLPSPVQTRGILVNYASFLDLDSDAILLRFADALQARHRERGPQKRTRAKAMAVPASLPPLRMFIASDLVFGGGLAIVLLLFAVWGISRVMAVRSETRLRATAPSISDVLVGTALPTLPQQVTLIPAANVPSQPAVDIPVATLELSTLDPNVSVQVSLTASERTYLRVTVDGKVQFEGRTDLNTTYTYEAANQIEILVGNASALRVVYNQHDLGLMGNFGQVVDRLYTAEGVATPTSTPPPTRTPTPNVTRTPTPTLSVTPSVTPTTKP